MNKEIMVTQSFLPPIEEYIDQLRGIWDNHWLTNNGMLHIKFENEVKEYLEVDNVTLYVNGHMALDVAIKALNLTGEVITTPFTFVSTTHAIVMNGLKPVFADIKEEDYTIDEISVEELITPETSAIVAVHVYGRPCNVIELEKIAKKYNLKLIFDAAHAFGTKIDGRSVASFGDISMFSFHATKVFHSIEGGALAYGDSTLSKKLKNLKNFGIEGPESVTEVGLNAKMNEFSAAMGICNLKYIESEIQKRKIIVDYYNSRLCKLKGIRVPSYPNNIKHNYSYYPILVDEKETGFTRNQLFDELKKNSIISRKYFYPLITEMECYKDKFKGYDLPVAGFVSERILALPIYGELDLRDVERICDIILMLGKGKK